MRACSAWPGADQAVNSPCRFLAEEEQRPSALLAWAFAETQAGREPMSPGSSISRSVVRQESPVSPLKQAVIAYLGYVYLPELREHLVVMLNGTAPRDGVDEPACEGDIFDVKGVGHASNNP
ncbi:MAG: hypothetical protein MHM6MM_009533, partial [Cercozoa sp. M6MM]